MSNTFNNVFDLLATAIEAVNERNSSKKDEKKANSNDTSKGVKVNTIKIDLNEFEDIAADFLKEIIDAFSSGSNKVDTDEQKETGFVDDFREPCCDKCSENNNCNLKPCDKKQDGDTPSKKTIREKLLDEIEEDIKREQQQNKQLDKINKICDYIEKSLSETGPNKKYVIIRGTEVVPHAVELRIPQDIAVFYDLRSDAIENIKELVTKKIGVSELYVQRDEKNNNGIVIYIPLLKKK